MWNNILILLIIISATSSEDYYKLLGLSRDAEIRDIRRAFKKLAVTKHPDKNSDDPEAHENFIKLTTAYEVLKDPELRKKYDLFGEEGLSDSRRGTNYHSWNYYHDNFGIYDDDPEVFTLTRNDYYENVINSEQIWFVNFYSPMCSHCHHLAPTWRTVAKELEGVIRVGAVNCEDDWQLCHQIGIRSYPTLLHYPRFSKHGNPYDHAKTHSSIVRFIMDRLDVKIKEYNQHLWNELVKRKPPNQKPTLVFTCNSDDCYTLDEKLKIAALFDKIINVGIFECMKYDCSKITQQVDVVVYFPLDDSKSPILFENRDANYLIQKILEQLPEPQDIDGAEFKKIKQELKSPSAVGWLICFYVGHMTELDVLLKRLPKVIQSINLGKINCGKYPSLCKDNNVNRYPMWGVLKPGGSFELNHGKDTINEIAKFAKNSIQAKNVWALSEETILSIMQRKNDQEVWFLDWYAPWCPPCLQFLPEVRKASLEFDPSVVRFGTIDCTTHTTICRNYNIRSYPTAMLINGSNTIQFTSKKIANNVVQFIHEARNPSVMQLTSKLFDRLLLKKPSKTMWVIDYFVSWCTPCQQLSQEWIKVAKSLKILSNVKIASVNCEVESDLCASQKINQYPTIRLYPIGSEGLNTVVLHNGQRDSLSLLNWINKFLPVKIIDLNPDTLKTKVLNGKEVWLVDYFAPWCDHCHRLEPQLAIAAQLLNKKVRVGRLNCDNYQTQCTTAQVRAYPTLFIYNTNKKQRSIDQGFRVQASEAQEIKQKVLEYLKDNAKHGHDEL